MKKLFTFWGAIAFGLPFIIFLPFLHLFAYKEGWHKYASVLNRWWAKIFWTLSFMPYKIEYKGEKPPKTSCVYCANHTSFLDIVTMGLIVKGDFLFIGKEELAKIPLFGAMFKKLHITVDRKSKISAYRSLLKSKESIDKNQSVVIFPEGGIASKNPPEIVDFKEGAFRLAIEKQVPIVPVTIMYNWVILPNDTFQLTWHSGHAIVHEPISTIGMTTENIEALKQKTYQIMRQPLLEANLITCQENNGNELLGMATI
jgi:1-acyl-sn-glycerol-3-phosphate acyltransferase